ncbi:helix-turn-helix protein [Herbihabitans rhizosphaerae]|uniref:Helix-turn-helix protein n=1 Tax=Herbihabitans rhizosphaerae TaxID=1872711 RepID=A0A4Q7L8D7_9PSEU|nr:helix-turn-helix transcriptional regulator [Herbihabitans rhizosphaerae]RZS44662.1 helix-turn-helix protein [Herbihabitans rhizosphaerae]
MRTPKARALGESLRAARKERDMTLRDLAKLIECDPGQISRWENGERVPKLDQVARILTKLDVTGERYDTIVNLAHGTDDGRWIAITPPEQREQLVALVHFEQSATAITVVSPLLVPGLLQTRDYTRAIMTSTNLSEAEASFRVALRMGRQDILNRPAPVKLTAYIGEAVFKQRIGTPQTMHEQMRHILNMATQSNVDVRVMPFDSGWHPGLETLFVIMESAANPTIVNVELRAQAMFMHEKHDVAIYREALAHVDQIALSPNDSTTLVAEYTDQWRDRV